MANPLITQLSNPAVLLKINQRLAVIVSVLLIIACAYLLVQIVWLFFPQDEEQLVPAQQQSRPVNNAQTQQNNFRKLTMANLFGVSETAVVQKPTRVPETKLNLTLKGVLAAVPMKHASAIIAQGKSGNEDIYGVGDKIPGGVVIREIHAEYVVLERNGQDEILKLEKISGIVDFESVSSPQSPQLNSNASPGAVLKEIRDSLVKNPTSFADYALPEVVKEKGRQIGYRLRPQGKGDMLSKLGIQSGDVITRVNGRRLNRPQNGIAALRSLSTAKEVNLMIKRNGAEVPLNITLQ